MKVNSLKGKSDEICDVMLLFQTIKLFIVTCKDTFSNGDSCMLNFIK